MRKLTLLLATILVLLLGLAGWFWFSGILRAQVYIQTARAADYPEAYGSIRSMIASGMAPQVFNGEELSEDPDGYLLADITVTLVNRGLFPAEWVDVRCSGVEGDIAVYALTGEGSDVAPRGSGKVNLKLITTAPPDAQREIAIQYYVHGLRRRITVR